MNYNFTFIILSCTCIFKIILKCILKHADFQYYAMKSRKFLLLIVKLKNIHEYNVLRSIYGYFPPKKIFSLIGILYHAFSLTFNVNVSYHTNLSYVCFNFYKNCC